MTVPELSVVVPTRNRARLLPGCLQSLSLQTAPADLYEVVVVDNGSTDDTSAVVLAHHGGQVDVRLVRADVPGVNRARNAGLRASRADVIAFVDDDEIVPRGWVRDVLALLAAHPEVAGVGGPYRDAPGPGPRTCSRCSLGAVTLATDPAGKTDRLLGGNMAIRRAAFELVGGFDDAISGRGDETEWFHRAAAAALTFHFDDQLSIEHRRDVFSLRQLLATQVRQGTAIPLAHLEMGERFAPRPRRAAFGLAHAIRHRCTRGLLTLARELGVLAWCLRHPVRSIRGPHVSERTRVS